MMLSHQEGIPKCYFQVHRFSASPVSRWCISSSQEQFSIPSSLIGAAHVIFCRAWVLACTPAEQNPSRKTAAKSGPALEPSWTQTELCLGNGAAKPGAGATTSLAAAHQLAARPSHQQQPKQAARWGRPRRREKLSRGVSDAPPAGPWQDPGAGKAYSSRHRNEGLGLLAPPGPAWASSCREGDRTGAGLQSLI